MICTKLTEIPKITGYENSQVMVEWSVVEACGTQKSNGPPKSGGGSTPDDGGGSSMGWFFFMWVVSCLRTIRAYDDPAVYQTTGDHRSLLWAGCVS